MFRILTSLAWSGFYRLGGIFAAFITNVILARMISKEKLGIYFLTFSIVMFLAIIMRAGIKQTSLKAVVWARNNNKCIISVISRILLFSLFTTVIVAVVSAYSLGHWVAEDFFRSSEMTNNVIWIVGWAAMVSLAAPIGESLRALHFPGWGAAMDMSLCNIIVALVLGGMYLVNYKIDYEELLIIWVVIFTIVNFWALGKLVREITCSTSYGERESCRNKSGIVFYKGVFPVFMLNISNYLLINASLWVVGYTLGHEDAAVYGAVIKLYNLLALPLIVINMGLEPHMADLFFSQQKKRLMLMLKMSAAGGLTITLLASATFVLFGKQLLEFIYGSGFGEGYSALVIILLGNIVNVWTGSCQSLLIISGKETILAILTSVGAVLCIALSIIYASSYGITGVAGTVTMSVAAINMAVWLSVRIILGIDTSAFLNPMRVREGLRVINAR